MPTVDSLHGADVIEFENGDVAITGTTAGYIGRSLVRGKGVQADWASGRYHD